jgi:hypothetical protein
MPATDLHLPMCYQSLVNFSVKKYVLMSGHPIFLIYVYKLWRFCLSTCLHLSLVSFPTCSYSPQQHLFQTFLEEKVFVILECRSSYFQQKRILFLKTTTIAAYSDVTNTHIIKFINLSLTNICLHISQNNNRNTE